MKANDQKRSHPFTSLVRFTDEENDRLMKLLRRRRLTAQAFIHAAVMRALNEADLGKEIIEEARKEEKTNSPTQGLGIRDRLQENRTHRDRDRRPVVSQPVQAAPAPLPLSTSADEIMTLARTIVETPQPARKEVLLAACRAFARGGRSMEEAMRLADELNAAIKRLDGTPQSALERVRARAGR